MCEDVAAGRGGAETHAKCRFHGGHQMLCLSLLAPLFVVVAHQVSFFPIQLALKFWERPANKRVDRRNIWVLTHGLQIEVDTVTKSSWTLKAILAPLSFYLGGEVRTPYLFDFSEACKGHSPTWAYSREKTHVPNLAPLVAFSSSSRRSSESICRSKSKSS